MRGILKSEFNRQSEYGIELTDTAQHMGQQHLEREQICARSMKMFFVVHIELRVAPRNYPKSVGGFIPSRRAMVAAFAGKVTG